MIYDVFGHTENSSFLVVLTADLNDAPPQWEELDPVQLHLHGPNGWSYIWRAIGTTHWLCCEQRLHLSDD